MAKRNEVFPNKYPKASDLNGKPIVVVIESAVQETLKTLDGKEQTKTVLYFKGGGDKGLVLNKTNALLCASVCGSTSIDDWPGQTVRLYPTMVSFQGRVVEAVRINGAAATPAEAAPAEAKRAKAAPAAPAPAADPNPFDDLDDEIPFD